MILIILILIVSPLLWWYLHLKRHSILNTIPGPKPLPIIGNTIQIGLTPQDFLKSLMQFQKEYGNVFKIYIGPELKTILVEPNMVEALLNSNVLIQKSNVYDLLQKWLGEGLLTSTGEKWRSRRKLITPSFHFKILDQFVKIFNSSAHVLIDKLEPFVGKESVDVFPFMNLCSLDNICETSMGIEVNAQKNQNVVYVTAVREFLNIFIRRTFSAWKQFELLFKFSSEYKLHLEYLKTLHHFTNNIIKTRREERSKNTVIETVSDDGIKPRIALLDMLLNSEQIHKLENEDIRAEIDTFMFEGHDTTTSALSFCLLALADNPNVQQKVYDEIVSIIGDNGDGTIHQYQEMKYFDMTIKEVLRVYPSVPYIERKLPTNAILGGQYFPKDSIVGIFIYGLGHSENIFPKPNIFDPERFSTENQSLRHNYGYVPFSAGPRNCIGQRFAILEVKAIISKVLQKYRICPVPNFVPELGMAAILKSYNGVCIRLEKRLKN